jgi:LCP family protein required for cell wall assembly
MALKPPGTYPDGASAPDGDEPRLTPPDAAPSIEQALREEQTRRFRRFVGRASLGSLIPGLGLLLAGRRLVGALVLASFILVLTAAAVALAGLTRTDLVALAVDPRFLVASAGALAVLALALLVNSAVSHHVLQPDSIRRGQRLGGAVVVVLVSSLVVTPVALASRYAMVQYELVTNVFVADPEPPDDPSRSGDDARDPRPYVDPWADVDRVNVLLIGSDAGPGREGTRPDTNIVASVDPDTGDTVLFSLPRNLQDVPFPGTSPLSEYYPWGWQGVPGDVGSELLNAVYRYVPAAHPELFEDVDDPGAEAMKLAAEGATGLAIDYYVMVDLDGFQQVVDALGGIDITVRQRIPLESSMLPAGYCSEPTSYLEPGRQRLTGYEALWYARVRCGGEGLSDDYDRMRRQRCVIGAMIDRADPLTVLRRYESLAGTARRIVSTDIPQEMVPAFAELALRVQDGQVRTLPFTNKVISTGAPDYALMRQLVSDALTPPPPASPTPTPSAGGSGTSTSSGGDADSGTSGGSSEDPPPRDESDGVLNLDDVC